MLTHLIAILSLALLCGAWVAFQRWLRRADPGARHIESGCGGCGGQCQTPDSDPARREEGRAKAHQA